MKKFKIPTSLSFFIISMFVLIAGAFALSPSQANAAVASDFGPFSMRRGSVGTYVANLQATLDLSSCGSAGLVTDGHFGPLTQGAVISFQLSHSLLGDGVVGPITKGALVACSNGVVITPPGSSIPGCLPGYLYSSTTGQPCNVSTGTLVINGTSGFVGNVQLQSQYNNETVGEGQNDVKVMSARVSASGSDLLISAINLRLEETSNSSASDRLDHYADSISVWAGSTRVASVPVSDFTRDSSGVYTDTVSLGNSVFIHVGQSVDMAVGISARSSINSTDYNNDSWKVTGTQLRYKDQTGATFSDLSTGDLANNGVTRMFDFDALAAATNTQLNISRSSSTPTAHIVNVSNTNVTNDVELLRMNFQATGSDLLVDSIPVKFTTSAGSVSNVTTSVTLRAGSQTWTESVSGSSGSTADITFNNLNYTINQGTTTTFSVFADINHISSTFIEGTTLQASVDVNERGLIDVQDSSGNSLISSRRIGTAIGDTLAFYNEGPDVSLVTTSGSVITGSGQNDDVATFTIRFTVDAFDSDVYIPSVISSTSPTAILVSIDKAGIPISSTQFNAAVSGVVNADSNATLTANNNYLVHNGTSATFTVTASMTDGVSGLTSGLYRMALTNLRWNTNDSNSAYNNYTFNLNDFKTAYQSVN